MASVSGVSSGNASSIYGNRNVLTGLATGMDTESMIENAVSGYKLKINNLIKQQTKMSWQQEAFRNVSDPLVQFARKYASYTSSTNLLSSSFFNNAVKTVTNGANADYVSASGKSASDVQILGVKQLASKAGYQVSAADLFAGLGGAGDAAAVAAQYKLDLDQTQKLSKVSGSLTLTYGANRTIDLSFDDLETFDTPEEFVSAINKKLENTTVSNAKGDMVAASTMVRARLSGGKINFLDNQAAGNTVTVTSATGKLKDTLSISPSAKSSYLDLTGLTDEGALVDASGTVGDYLSGKTFSMTVDGRTKTITLPAYERGVTTEDQFIGDLDRSLKSAFGSKVGASFDAGGRLQITGQKGSTISIDADDALGKALGFRSGIATSYLNTGDTLGNILGLTRTYDGETMAGIQGEALKGVGKITLNKETNAYYDTQGNRTDAAGNRLGKDGKQLYGYEFQMNGVSMTFTRDDAMESVLTQINSNSDIGFTATFSKTTNNFQFTANETGTVSSLVIDNKVTTTDANGSTRTRDNLAAKLFGVVNDPTDPIPGAEKGTYTAGRDAVLTMSVNGSTFDNITRTDNNFNVDGLSITLKGTFGYTATDADGHEIATDTVQPGTEAVTFTTSSDADKIVEAIKGMVEDLNKIMQTAHSAYSDLPITKSDKSRYEPLTDEEQDGMTESEIKNYEEKAKTGVLFGDRDLSAMYDKLLDAISPSGANGSLLRSLGLTTDYSEGVTTLKLDETALRDMLDRDPDSVRDAFTKTDGGGGLMVNLNKVLDSYVSTTGASKGILIEKAGSTYSSLSLLHNTISDQMDELDDQITSWREKMSDKIDYYTQQFSRLEQLTQQMNSQSSMLMGMMGGGS